MARCRIVDLRHKQVVNVKDGTCLGCVDDMEIDMATAKLVSIIIYGRLKWFGCWTVRRHLYQMGGYPGHWGRHDSGMLPAISAAAEKRRFFNRNT